MTTKRKTLPENPIEFFLLDLYLDEELPDIALDLTGNTQPHTGYHLFNSSDTRPSLDRLFEKHGFPPVGRCWKSAHRYFKARYELEAAIRAQNWGGKFLMGGRKSRSPLEREVEVEREKLREQWPCIPTRQQMEDDPGYRRRVLNQLLADRKQSGGLVQGETSSEGAAGPVPGSSPVWLPPSPAKGLANSVGPRIVPPHVPQIPRAPSDSSLPGRSTTPVKSKMPASTGKRKRAEEESGTSAPGSSNSKPSRSFKKHKKSLRPENTAYHAPHGDFAQTQVQAKYPSVADTLQPSVEPMVYQFSTIADFSSQTGNNVHGRDPNYFFNGPQSYLQPQIAADNSVYSGSQWKGQSDYPFGSGEPSGMSQQFGDQSTPYAELGGSQGSMAGASGHQVCAQPPTVSNVQVGGPYANWAGESSQTLGQPGFNFGSAQEELLKTAENCAGILFRNYSWCRVRPPWGKLLELAQSEAAWNAWVDAPLGQLAL